MALVNSNTQPHFPVQKIYDPGAGTPVQGAGGAAFSLIARVPRIITLTGLDATTTVIVKGKVHNDSAWHTIATFDGSVSLVGVHEFDPRWNFVELERTAGAANPVAYAQS